MLETKKTNKNSKNLLIVFKTIIFWKIYEKYTFLGAPHHYRHRVYGSVWERAGGGVCRGLHPGILEAAAGQVGQVQKHPGI